MNQYSSWKYILILLTIGLSLLYVTPNFYGESFAVQVMPVKAGETIDTSTLKLVESSLDKAKIQNIGIAFEDTDIKIKFSSYFRIMSTGPFCTVCNNDIVVAVALIRPKSINLVKCYTCFEPFASK